MTDSVLSEDAKKLLDDLAKALPGIKCQEHAKGNRQYEPKDVSPYVKPLLAAIGLKVLFETLPHRDALIRSIFRTGSSRFGCFIHHSSGRIYPAQSTLFRSLMYLSLQGVIQGVRWSTV